MVIACAALFLALGGSGIAAAVLVVPKNSVGTAQIRNGAVISSKVKNHSLLAKDFKKGQLRPGPAGPEGPGIETWAIVKADAKIDQSSNVASVTSAGVGAYMVTFTASVAGCSIVASAGTDTAGEATRGAVADFARTTNPATIEVTTSTGTTAAAHAFTLAAICPPAGGTAATTTAAGTTSTTS